MTTVASQINSLMVVYSTIYSDADQRKHQSSASLAFVWGIHRDRWIPRTKGQLRGKCFHLMTSSCCQLGTSAPFQYQGHLFGYIGISIIKIRWSWACFIFIMAIPILVSWYICVKTVQSPGHLQKHDPVQKYLQEVWRHTIHLENRLPCAL